MFFFFKQKTAYEMRISDWSSDVCSSDLQPDDDHRRADVHRADVAAAAQARRRKALPGLHALPAEGGRHRGGCDLAGGRAFRPRLARAARRAARTGRRAQDAARRRAEARAGTRSEEHTSELQSLMRNSYAVF